MGHRLATAENAPGKWHSWHIVLIAVTVFAGCGGSTATGHTASGGSAGAAAGGGGSAGTEAGGGGSAGTEAGSASCSACAPDAYTCLVTGAESATLSITSRTASGCSGTLQAYNKAELTCATSTICYAKQCVPFTEDSSGLHFSIGTSPVVCFPN